MSRYYLPSRVLLAISVPFILLAIGTIGYSIFGGDEWSTIDAMYMSAITLTTVGYGETHPLTTSGRIFTIVFLFGGVFLLFYSATEIIRAVITGQFQRIMGQESTKHALENIRDHIIICGYGRMGAFIAHEFEKQKKSYVIIDREGDRLDELQLNFGVALHGDATEDEVLKRAGVDRAKVLVAVLPSDADNLYITLSARVLSSSIYIIARAEEEAAEPKLRRVGANQVVSPYVIGGYRVAQAILRPNVQQFLEQALRYDATDYAIEEVVLSKNCKIIGKTLKQTDLGKKIGVVVISIKCPSGEMIFSPQGSTVIEAGSVIVAIGHREQLKHLEDIASGKADIQSFNSKEDREEPSG